MIFNVVCSILVVFAGGAVQIYTFSNVGYLASFLPVLVGYYLLRKDRPNVRRPFKLPEWMKYVALALAAFYTFIYFYGGTGVRDLRLQRRRTHDACRTTSSASACCCVPAACTGGASGSRIAGDHSRPGEQAAIATPAAEGAGE